MTTETETPVGRYARAYDEYHRLRRIHSDQRTPADYAAMTAAKSELRAILAVPPTGYALPPAARRLIDHALAHGWQGMAHWYPPPGQDEASEPFVTVIVGRHVTAAEDAEYDRGTTWEYKLTWHSRGCPPGRLRLFGQGLAETPDAPAVHHAPTVAAITAVITAHPGPGAA